MPCCPFSFKSKLSAWWESSLWQCLCSIQGTLLCVRLCESCCFLISSLSMQWGLNELWNTVYTHVQGSQRTHRHLTQEENWYYNSLSKQRALMDKIIQEYQLNFVFYWSISVTYQSRKQVYIFMTQSLVPWYCFYIIFAKNYIIFVII